jgi:hypothetical protein
MATLALDEVNWDLTVDASGNIAVATNGQDIAQDVASAIKLFRGELWFDTTQGVPWFQSVLGQTYSVPVLQALINKAALSVPGVVRASTVISSISGRTVSGNVEVIDTTGASLNVQFTR